MKLISLAVVGQGVHFHIDPGVVTYGLSGAPTEARKLIATGGGRG